MKTLLLDLFVRMQNGLAVVSEDETGAMPVDAGNLVWLLVGILAIIALIIWIKPHIN